MSDLVPAASELANVSAAASNSGGAEPWWPRGWWKIMDTRIGIIPIPVFVILFALLVGFTYTGDIKGEVSMMIAVLVVGGFTCAEIGKRIPVLRNIGSAAIFATFIPSALAYYKLIPPQIEKSIIEFTKYTNFLYLFIACIIVGSILGMDRNVLVKGFVKIFVPLALGSIAAGADWNPGRDHAGARRSPQLLLRRASHHGRRRRRRRDSAFDRVFGNPAPTARRRVRADPAADHARQPDRDHPVRYSELRRQAISAV